MKMKRLSVFAILPVLMWGSNVVMAQSPNPPESLLDAPVHVPEDVLAIYSDSYTVAPEVATILNGTEAEEMEILGNKMYHVMIGSSSEVKTDACYMMFDEPLDLSGYNTFFMDVYAVEKNAFNLSIRLNGAGKPQQLSLPVKTGWNRLEYDLNDFKLLATVPDLTSVSQINFVGEGLRTLYIDNIYACKSMHSDMEVYPTVPAPTPIHAAENVLPIFTDVYAGEIGGTLSQMNDKKAVKGFLFNPEAGLDRIIFAKGTKGGEHGFTFNQTVDITGYDYLHFDVFPIGRSIPMRIILNGASKGNFAIATVSDLEQWNPVDLSLEYFMENIGTTIPDFTQINKFWFFEKGGGSRTFFLDNIYFYKSTPTGVDINRENKVTMKFAGRIVELSSEMEIARVHVFDASGKTLSVQDVAGTQTKVGLPDDAGIYLLRIEMADGKFQTKRVFCM